MSIKFSQLKFLLIEDNKCMIDLILSVLEGLCVQDVIVSTNGEDAFEIFLDNDIDIIIADWEMDPVNGIEFTDNVRRNPKSPDRTVPIILLTGYAAPKRVKLARDAGVTEYMIKPFTAETLIKRITHVINHPRSFVLSQNYIGPNRRRRQDPYYQGPKRRQEDNK